MLQHVQYVSCVHDISWRVSGKPLQRSNSSYFTSVNVVKYTTKVFKYMQIQGIYRYIDRYTNVFRYRPTLTTTNSTMSRKLYAAGPRVSSPVVVVLPPLQARCQDTSYRILY